MKARKARCDGEATREAILVAAAAEFSEKGFELASIREICRRAGANIALANRYFESKEKLYRLVAERLFRQLEQPMTEVAEDVVDAKSWRAALEKWVGDFLFMTIPTERPQRLCRGLFRQEVTAPTKFHAEFERDFGKPIYDSLWRLIARVETDPVEIELVISSIWAQVSVYALADMSWQKAFRPEGVSVSDWRNRVCDFICRTVFGRIRLENLNERTKSQSRQRRSRR